MSSEVTSPPSARPATADAAGFEGWFRRQHPAIPLAGAAAVLRLAGEGGTVPFIARYRKEQTGNLDEVQIRAALDAKDRFDRLQRRQATILESIERHGKLTPELRERILTTFDPDVLEDLYLPYKQKKKTRAQVAREAGLEPLAEWIWNCAHGLDTPQPGQTLELWAYTFRNEAAGFATLEAVLQGAQDLLTERLAEHADLRQQVREALFRRGHLRSSKAAGAQSPSKFEKYFDHTEPIGSLLKPESSHRYMAMRRGAKEGELKLTVAAAPDDPELDARLHAAFEKAAVEQAEAPGAELLRRAARAALDAHVRPSIENEVHRELKLAADAVAIRVFADNVRRLLLASPFGPRAVLGIDPGVRTGCKLAAVDGSGRFLASHVLHLKTEEEQQQARALLAELLRTVPVDAIAVGNGTAGRETEIFLRRAVKELGHAVPVVLVSEAGASVYSASELAREELPELDVSVRGAVSIARRLQDPLAELVKIEPKSLGVGQYQHDVAPAALKSSLDDVVDSCVHQVGIDLNTASRHLLGRVAGIGPALGQAIVERREQGGLFRSRAELLDVPHFTRKTFEQAAGFLRIRDGSHPLDATGVHPERYAALESLAGRCGCGVAELLGPGAERVKGDARLREELGEYTFADVVAELEKPGRDPREGFVPFAFRDDVHALADLKPGMRCPGIVTNVTSFGAFVDVGVHQDGLVHLSRLADRFVKDPSEVVRPGQRVEVTVVEVNLEKKQIALSMRSAPTPRPRPERRRRSAGAASGGGRRSPAAGAEATAAQPPTGAAASSSAEAAAGERAGGQGSRRERRPERPAETPPPLERRPLPGDRRSGGDHRPGPRRSTPPAGAGQRRGERPPAPSRPAPPRFSNNPFAALAELKKDIKRRG